MFQKPLGNQFRNPFRRPFGNLLGNLFGNPCGNPFKIHLAFPSEIYSEIY